MYYIEGLIYLSIYISFCCWKQIQIQPFLNFPTVLFIQINTRSWLWIKPKFLKKKLYKHLLSFQNSHPKYQAKAYSQYDANTSTINHNKITLQCDTTKEYPLMQHLTYKTLKKKKTQPYKWIFTGKSFQLIHFCPVTH